MIQTLGWAPEQAKRKAAPLSCGYGNTLLGNSSGGYSQDGLGLIYSEDLRFRDELLRVHSQREGQRRSDALENTCAHSHIESEQ